MSAALGEYGENICWQWFELAGSPHRCMEREGHNGAHRCCCGEWDADLVSAAGLAHLGVGLRKG